MMEWSNDRILDLIARYETEPVLWNPLNQSYMKKNQQSEAWLRIKANLSWKASVEELKRKMKSLMAYYRYHTNKYKKSIESGADEIYKPCWFAFPAFNQFLGPLYECQSLSTEQNCEESEHKIDLTEDNVNEESPVPTPSRKRPKRDHSTEIYITGDRQQEQEIQEEQDWSNERILEFIQNYETEPILWDPHEPNYKKKHLNYEAWVRIKANLSWDVTVEQLKNKMKSLMAYYRIHSNKYKKSMESGADEIYHTNWFAFPAMNSFLGPIYECQSTILSTSECEDSPIEERRKSKRRKIPNRDNLSPEIVDEQEMQDAVEYVETNIDDDEYEIFGKLIATKIKKIKDYNTREILMNDIFNMISRASMMDPL